MGGGVRGNKSVGEGEKDATCDMMLMAEDVRREWGV